MITSPECLQRLQLPKHIPAILATTRCQRARWQNVNVVCCVPTKGELGSSSAASRNEPSGGRPKASVASAVGAAGNPPADLLGSKWIERGIIRQQNVFEKSSGPQDEAEKEYDEDKLTCLEQVMLSAVLRTNSAPCWSLIWWKNGEDLYFLL